MLDKKNFTIVDVETTGGSPFFNRVIEIGLLRVERGEVVEQFQTLLNPEMEIPEFISRMTGITQNDVAAQPTFGEIAEDLLAKFEDAIFVAHNVAFDYNFLKEEFRRSGFSFNLDRLCTVRLSRSLYNEHKRHNLTAIIERYNFECKNRHRAYDDAKVLWDFLQMSSKQIDPEEFNKAINQVTTKSRIAKPATSKKDSILKNLKLKTNSSKKALENEVVYIPEFDDSALKYF